MKNKVIYIFLTFILFFSFSSRVVAEEAKCTAPNDQSKCYVNTGSDADKDYLILDKNKIVDINDNVKAYYIPNTNYHLQKISWKEIISEQFTLTLYTDSYDETVNNPNKWHSNLYVCKKIDWGILSFGSTGEGGVFTSSLLSKYAADNEAWYKAIVSGTDSNCWTFRVQDVPVDNQVSYCSIYENLNKQIENYAQKYKDTKNPEYISDYKKVTNKLKNSCSQVMAGADYDDACVIRCLGYSSDKADWDKKFEISHVKTECGFSERLVGFIVNILKWIKYILPVAVIILGILDFIKAIGSDKEAEMKKAQGKFVKRLIAAALVFLVPLIIVFILEKMGFVVKGCGFIDV